MAFVTKLFTNIWRRKPRLVVGLDLTPSGMRFVALERSFSADTCVHAVHLALPQGAVNGLVLEDFDTVVDVLAEQVHALGLVGCSVALALPSHGVRELSWPAWDGEPQLWDETHVYKHVQQHMQLPQEAWSIDFGLEHEAPVQQAWAVVARESVVQERYELAEQAGLQPNVLDVDRLALDRLLDVACQVSQVWPSVWLVLREGVLSAHVALAPSVVLSRSAYFWQGDTVVSQLRQLLSSALEGCDTSLMLQGPVSVRFTGLHELRVPLMEALKVEWQQAFELPTPCAAWLETADASQPFAVALGLALHPSLV